MPELTTSLDVWVVLMILVTALVLFITEWVRMDVVALGAVVALMLSGILTTAEGLSGFSNPAVLTIAALFIVGGGVLQTGLAGMIGYRILRIAGESELRLTVVLMAAVASLSSFMSDTGTVAVLLPAVIILARTANISPGKLLIPLAFGSLLGGAATLIGTPPNIITSEILAEAGYAPFSFFDFTPMGLVLIVLGILFMVLVGRRLLPDRRPKLEGQRVATPEELVDIYRLPDDLYRLRVRRGSELAGMALAESHLRLEYCVSVLKILRREAPRPSFTLFQARLTDPPPAKRITLIPEADTRIEDDDILIVQGDVDDVSHAAAVWNLGVQPATPVDEDALISGEVGIAEVLLPPRSDLVGKTLLDVRFGSTYKLTVLGINRPGGPGMQDLKNTRLAFGDILLVQGAWRDIMALRSRQRDFLIIGQPESLIGVPNRRKAPLAFLILAGMVVLMITNLTSVATASILAALMMVLTGCLTMDEAYQSINWKSIILVAGMLPMSIALQKVALVDMAADSLTGYLGGFGPLVVMTGLFLITSGFTQVLSNTATTVVVAPVALVAAQRLGVQPQAFLMAVSIAASMAFASPVASPVNTLVMGSGDYSFGDYLRVGLPLILLTLIASVIVLPLLWPFY